MNCPYCGKKAGDGHRYCAYCGAPLQRPEGGRQPEPLHMPGQGPRKRRNGAMTALIILFILLAIGVGAIFMAYYSYMRVPEAPIAIETESSVEEASVSEPPPVSISPPPGSEAPSSASQKPESAADVREPEYIKNAALAALRTYQGYDRTAPEVEGYISEQEYDRLRESAAATAKSTSIGIAAEVEKQGAKINPVVIEELVLKYFTVVEYEVLRAETKTADTAEVSVKTTRALDPQKVMDIVKQRALDEVAARPFYYLGAGSQDKIAAMLEAVITETFENAAENGSLARVDYTTVVKLSFSDGEGWVAVDKNDLKKVMLPNV